MGTSDKMGDSRDPKNPTHSRSAQLVEPCTPAHTAPMTYQIYKGPRRIVCLTEEPTEILWTLGEEHRIVGISAYTVRPPEARETRPIVSAFIGGSVEKIQALEPDLVIGFSDIQADLARDLIAANLQVLIFNQRTIAEILSVILAVGRLVDAGDRAEALVQSYVDRLASVRRLTEGLDRPRVYFEEWDDPTITAIEWVSELIEIAGGENVFAAKSRGRHAKDRFVQVEEIVAADPEVYLASWCGKPFDREAALARPGVGEITAVQTGRVHEIPPEIILQPGPACLTDGLDTLLELIHPGLSPDS